jgi:hypothetical protein
VVTGAALSTYEDFCALGTALGSSASRFVTCSPSAVTRLPAGLRTPFIRSPRAARRAERRYREAAHRALIGDQVADDRCSGLFADGHTIVLRVCTGSGRR